MLTPSKHFISPLFYSEDHVCPTFQFCIPYSRESLSSLLHISGIGFGLVYSPCLTVFNFYFKRRRALAMGILLFGGSVGSVLFPYLYKFLIDLYGLQGAILVISAVILNICVCAALIRQPKELKEDKLLEFHLQTHCKKESLEEDSTSTFPARSCTVSHPKRPIFFFSLFRQSSFTIYTFGFMCSFFVVYSNFVLIPGYARVQGMTSADIAVFLSVIGGVMIFARPTVGWLADSDYIEKRNIVGTCVIIGGVFSIVLPWIPGYYSMLIYSITVGIFPNSSTLFIPLLLLEIVPLEKLPQAQGLVFLCLSLSAVLSEPISGMSLIRILEGNSYNSTIYRRILKMHKAIVNTNGHVKTSSSVKTFFTYNHFDKLLRFPDQTLKFMAGVGGNVYTLVAMW
jgi:MCP family monocarboxylic acid transporter-like MFS transporter 13/MCP family monocarboxylic acid transporter-like MFS transporter 12